MVGQEGGSQVQGGDRGQSKILEFLSKVSFFQFLSEHELQSVASRLNLQTHEAGDVIFNKGDEGDALHILVSGSVKIYMPAEEGEEAPLALLKPGDYFGDLALLDAGPRTASAAALVPSATLTIGRDEFLNFVTTNPKGAAAVFQALASLIRKQDTQLFGKFFED